MSSAVVVPGTGDGWRAWVDGHRPWAVTAAAHLVLLAVLLPLIVVDERLFQGVSVWIKPAKFALSIAVYLGTLVLFARLVPEAWWATRAGRAVTAVAIGTASFEMGYIALMAGLGRASHFNDESALTALLYSLMGVGALALVAVAGVLACVIARHRGLRDPVVLAVVLGLGLTFVLGGGTGAWLGAQSGHWVDVAPTDAGGLPLFGWTRDGGDLRVAHFFGMHAMQVLPLLALAVRGLRGASAMVLGAAVLYAGFTVATFLQALAGRPLL
jgi:hypothetical protein